MSGPTRLRPPLLGPGPSTIPPCVQAEPEHSNGQSTAIPVVGSPTSDPSSQARLTLQGERNQGVAFRIGRQGPALGSSGPAHLCLPSSLPAASSWLWSGDVAQLSSGQVLESTWEPQRVKRGKRLPPAASRHQDRQQSCGWALLAGEPQPTGWSAVCMYVCVRVYTCGCVWTAGPTWLLPAPPKVPGTSGPFPPLSGWFSGREGLAGSSHCSEG